MSPEQPRDLLEILRGPAQPLYGLLDAARDPIVFKALERCQEEYQSLYEGDKALELDAYAPYLVRLPAQSPLLETLVRAGWSNGWGFYLTCNRPLLELRTHFRRFLTIELEGQGPAYFRFYDPRVLRVFLPTCTSREAAELFGPVHAMLMESSDPAVLLRFTTHQQGVKQDTVPVFPGARSQVQPSSR